VTPLRNRLLAQLPRGVQERLAAQVRPVALRVGDVLFRARAPAAPAYFPESGLVSLLTSVRSGETVDVGLVGSESVVGALPETGTADMPFEGAVRVQGIALKIEADALRAQTASEPHLAGLLARHAQFTVAQCVTSAACIAFHPAGRRCARWLLVASDLLASTELPLTHDQLAHMMGVRRESVTVALGSLDARGLVAHGRAHIVIRDRSGLEAATCECYGLMRDERRRLIGV
jgi:CRP-like cAMP-binding protein